MKKVCLWFDDPMSLAASPCKPTNLAGKKMIYEDLAAAVLAGGKSRRFGRQKARARWGKIELVDCSLKVATAIASTSFIVHSKAEIFADKEVDTVVDLIAGVGPVGGMMTALARCDKPWLASIPCDMPLLDRCVYDVLYQNKQPDRPTTALSTRGSEPLISIWPKIVLAQVEEYISDGGLSLKGLLSRLNAATIRVSDHLDNFNKEMFLNINTPADLARLETASGEGKT